VSKRSDPRDAILKLAAEMAKASRTPLSYALLTVRDIADQALRDALHSETFATAADRVHPDSWAYDDAKQQKMGRELHTMLMDYSKRAKP
jgi:hypothetical protein